MADGNPDGIKRYTPPGHRSALLLVCSFLCVSWMEHGDHEHDHATPFDFFTQPTTMASPVNPIGMDSIDLNTQVLKFPHLSSYKDILQSSSRGTTLKRKSGGDASSKAAMLFRPPRSTGRGGSRSIAATARSAPQTQVVVAAAGGSKSTPQFNAADGGNSGSAPLADVGDGLEDDDGSFGHDHLMNFSTSDEEDETIEFAHEHLKVMQ
ncbi:hypothetical protein ABZP36_016774 [Zizania latifolia]